MKKNCFNAGIAAIIISGSMLTAHADSDDTTTNNRKDPATHNKPAYGDNPSLGRVLLYKTGKSIQNVGDAIQRSSDQVSARLKQGFSRETQLSESDPDHVSTQLKPAVTANSGSLQQNNSNAIASDSNSRQMPTQSSQQTIPIVQNRLSQSSTFGQTTSANANPSNLSPEQTNGQSQPTGTGTAKTYAIEEQ